MEIELVKGYERECLVDLRARQENQSQAPFRYFLCQSDLSTAAATLGRKGGRAKSAAKTAAVRENGRKGGRPSWKAQNQIMAKGLANRVYAFDQRGDTVLRDQELRELKQLLAYIPSPRSAPASRMRPVNYRLPSGAKTPHIWSAVRRWRLL